MEDQKTSPTPGVGTSGNREDQKTDASKSGDTRAPGVPAPTPGGPPQPESAPKSTPVGPGTPSKP